MADVVTSSPIVVTLIKELSSSETSTLTGATPRNIPMFFGTVAYGLPDEVNMEILYF
jgi:hypothetical protein